MLVHNFNLFFVTLVLLSGSRLFALPIGFGTPPAGLEYDEIKSKNFYVYHDHRTPNEAKMTLNSLEAARPLLENWFKIKRDSPLPVVMSATTENASFANFITDAVELQTMGLGTKDLTWHEYTHSTMYRHLDNWLGPAGSILHLMWMPSWFVEGLAEALSVSIGSDEQASIERYQALSGDWPTYEQLHALYTSGDFAYRGYATSGALVSYLLRTANANMLPNFLEDYYFSSMPWWWPYSLIPFVDSLPLDTSLKTFAGVNGKALYENYKKAAKEYWQSQDVGTLHSAKMTSLRDFSNLGSLQVRGNKIYKIHYEENSLDDVEVKFKNEWGHSLAKNQFLPTDTTSRMLNSSLRVYAISKTSPRGHKTFTIQARSNQSNRLIELTERKGFASNLNETGKSILWREHEEEQTRLCLLPKHPARAKGRGKAKPTVECPFRATLPKRLEIIGEHRIQVGADYHTIEIIVKEAENTLYGDRYRLIAWNPDDRLQREINLRHGGNPIAVGYANDEAWLLNGERNKRTLRQIGLDGQCVKMLEIADMPYSVHGTDDGHLILPLFAGEDNAILKLDPNTQKTTPCAPVEPLTSPITYALRHPETKDLAEVMTKSSPWQTPNETQIASVEEKIKSAKSLDQESPSKDQIDKRSKPARWRPKPVFGVPWIGADSGGSQYGILSIPLMDDMQDETLRAYLAYGLESRFPHTELSLTSTRFWPTLQLDAFRYQTWNGTYRNRVTGNHDLAFLDERGVRLSTDTFFRNAKTLLSLGMKSSNLKRYIGWKNTRQGNLHEPFINITRYGNIRSFNLRTSLGARVAPEAINKNFDYNQVMFDTDLSRGVDFLNRTSVFRLGLDYSRTRGPKRRELQEVYRPLKIFVPGSGSGLNNLNFPLIGSGGLFSARYGNNQARAATSFTFPIVEKVDKLIRLFYLSRFNFTGFFNYGGAWYGGLSPEEDDLIAAHGYNFDLLFDIKGINFYLGQGFGQVFGSPLETYITFGFEAIF